MNAAAEKILETIKRMPAFRDLLEKQEIADQEKEQRLDDIPERQRLLKEIKEMHARHTIEREAHAKVAQAAKDAHLKAQREGHDLNLQHMSEVFQMNKAIGAIEARLQLSAPQYLHDRVEAIDEEIEKLAHPKKTSGYVDLDKRGYVSTYWPDAMKKIDELRAEREDILKRQIYETIIEGENHD